MATLMAAPAAAQQRPLLTPGQAGSMLAAGAVYVAASVVAPVGQAPSCAPCDPATVPAFDRWAIHTPIGFYGRASNVLLVGLAAGAILGAEGNRAGASVTVEGAGWAVAGTAIVKELVGRLRPEMYTADAPAVAGDLESRRSFPSGHAAAAAALAVGFWLNNPHRRPLAKVALVIGAVGVGALRVAAGKHFPSDVLAGAAVGTASAFVVHAIRF